MSSIVESFSNLSFKFKQVLTANKMNPVLMTAIIAYLLITPIDAILYLQWINSMTNYKWMAGGVIYPFFGLLFFAIPTVWKIAREDIKTDSPKKELAAVGLMDSLGSIMAALTIPFISIMLNVVVSKLVLPITLVASYFILKKRYLWTHYTGVAITIFGVLTAAVPKLVMGNENTNPIAMVVFIFSLIPSVASYIIKEIYLKNHPDADSWYMNTVISIFQVAIGFLTLPLVMLPLPGFNVKPHEFGAYISNSLNCQFGGKNSMDGDDCKLSFLYLITFQVFGTIANILMFTIIREGSSVMFIMINTLKTPITALMGFCLIYYNLIKFTEGESFVLTWLDIVSLVLVVIGSIFYAMRKEIEAGDSDQDDCVYTILENKESIQNEQYLTNPFAEENTNPLAGNYVTKNYSRLDRSSIDSGNSQL